MKLSFLTKWLTNLFTRNSESIEAVADIVIKKQLKVTDDQLAKVKELVKSAESNKNDSGEIKKAKVSTALLKVWNTLEPVVIDCLVQHAVMLLKKRLT
jgi:hypothetical protein